jgi:hypothetical protein
MLASLFGFWVFIFGLSMSILVNQWLGDVPEI